MAGHPRCVRRPGELTHAHAVQAPATGCHSWPCTAAEPNGHGRRPPCVPSRARLADPPWANLRRVLLARRGAVVRANVSAGASFGAPCGGPGDYQGCAPVDVLGAGARCAGTALDKACNHRRDNKRERTQSNDQQSPKRPIVQHIHCLSFTVDHGIRLGRTMQRARQIWTDSYQDGVKGHPPSPAGIRPPRRLARGRLPIAFNAAHAKPVGACSRCGCSAGG
jgi:hypothetical protein